MRFPLRAPLPARWSASLLGSLALGLFLHVSAQAADLRVGFMPGPYRDAFTNGMGYAVKYVEFS